jgi:hypothetical protein
MWTNNASELRLKRNVKPLQGALQKLLNLRGVSYKSQEPEKRGNLTGEQMGFVAQEVEEVFPKWVSMNTDGFKDLTICGLKALVVEAFRGSSIIKSKRLSGNVKHETSCGGRVPGQWRSDAASSYRTLKRLSV